MNSRKHILILGVLSIIITFVGCSSEYSKQVKAYENLFNETIMSIESENIYESIKQNNLTSNIKQLKIQIEKIHENIPNDKVNDFLVLRTKHNRLKEIIENGLNWDSLGELDKLSIKTSINILKPE